MGPCGRREEGEGRGFARPLPPGPLPAPARAAPASPAQDQSPGHGPLRVAVEPRQRLVLGVLREDAVGGLGERRSHGAGGTGRPARAHPTPTHLVQEAEPLEGLAVLHLPRHPGPANARNTLARRPRPSDRPALASAQGLLGNVVPGPRSPTLRPHRSICLNCFLSHGPFLSPSPGFLPVVFKSVTSYTR